MTASHLPLPMAYADPAFDACIAVALDTPELITEFDRLYGADLMSGKVAEGDMRVFVNFVHRCLYLALPDESIHSMRRAAIALAA
ncbi:hypothetical protein [Comamonas squillarum]|uniref:Uncharacterized protein n=1 Tax=Comamonas squillarum TaxID=2977320 RepID=A0ABY6A198_9BURK|nr:hypothetical protein [Comamonas sp. PR12]UXC20035.1 hypothetical protein N4T19_07985 [Comamonas sp. PR12]